MASILCALQNAKFNLENAKFGFQAEIGMAQLRNAVILLEKGYDTFDEVDTLLEKYGDVEGVPEKGDEETE